MKPLGLGTLVGSLLLFIWSAISWMVLPWHNKGFKTFSNQGEVLRSVATGAPESGVYLAAPPAPGEPFVHAIVQRHGPKPLGQAMLLGFLGNLLAAFLATLLLLQLGPRSLVEKLLFLLTAAVLAWSGRYFADVAYWGLPLRNALVDLADMLIAWTLAGAALAWITHPRRE